MTTLFLAALLSALFVPFVSAQPLLFAEAHLHYNWNQAEVTSPDEACSNLYANDVALAVVSSTPLELPVSLREAGGDQVLPFFRPYARPGDWLTWTRDESVPDIMREAPESGRYFGIGELNPIPGFGQRWDTPIFRKVNDLAKRHRMPVRIHTESSAPDFFMDICRRHPEARFLSADGGGILQPDVGARTMSARRNV